MTFSNQQQLVLGCSVLFGFGLGMFYDLFRIFRTLVSCGKVTVFLQDMIYFFLSSFLAFGFILILNDGAVRLYLLIAFIIGWLLCYYTLGRGMVRLASVLRRAVISARTRRKKQKHCTDEKEKG